MFDWLRRIFQAPDESERGDFFEMIDALNAKAGGGRPTVTKQVLGSLTVRSGTLIMADPQYVPDLEISNVTASEVAISAELRRYPSGQSAVISLGLTLGNNTNSRTRRKIGVLGIDSAKVVVMDKADFEDHWTEVGKDRIGVISTARDDTVLRLLTNRFKLKANRVHAIRAEVVGPVSETLEKEIENYLMSNPEYAHFPEMYFYVQTNNSFERANFLHKTWDFIPVGNADAPLMFVSGTGRGDGAYDVYCDFSGHLPTELSIKFIDD